jgi:hypothetical protein
MRIKFILAILFLISLLSSSIAVYSEEYYYNTGGYSSQAGVYTCSVAGAVPQACPNLNKRVPQAMINDALANANKIYAWCQGNNQYEPVGPSNPARLWLSMHRNSIRYNRMWNSLEYKSGCP